MKKVIAKIINGYKRLISVGLKSAFGGGCRYVPSCSLYAKEAVGKYGIFRGSYLGIKRVLKCNPFMKGGYDPVI